MLKLDFASSLKPVKRAKRAKTPFFGVFGVFGPKMTLFGGLKKGVFFDPFFGPKNTHMFFGVTKNSVIPKMSTHQKWCTPKNELTHQKMSTYQKVVYTKKRVDTPKMSTYQKVVYTKKRVDTSKNEYIPKSGVHQKTS